MTEKLKYIIFEADIGWVGILASAKGLLGTTLPQGSVQEASRLLGESVNGATWSPELFTDLVGRLTVYYSGYQVAFPDEPDLSAATLFQREVWEVTRLIPFAETRNYLWVANQMRKPGAARAVGQALARNPLPIVVPCHRVVASDGSLGGFSGGLEMKRYLLRLEASAGR